MDFLTDPVFLSRLQFALTTAFHITFPTLTIGLGVYLVVVEWLWLRTGDLVYFRQFRFWSRLFAVNFAVGVVSGIPLEFQFGTNWGPFSATVGNFFGQVLGFEGTMAFMLESAFLYIMLFGWKRVGPKMHFTATILVAFGASLSAFWILVANSWMQTPSGGHVANGIFVVDDYLAAIFSPDLPLAFTHMYLACLEVSLFVIGAVSGINILLGRHTKFYLKSFKIAAVAALVVTPLQALVGDANGQEIGRLQPAKVAAIEAHWNTNKPGTGAPWNMLAWPDPEHERNYFQIEIPYGLSLLITHSPTGIVPGLKDFPKEDRPPIVLPFYSFRLMVGIGFMMVGVMLWTFWEWKNGRLTPEAAPGRKWLYLAWAAMAGGAYVSVVMGWITREVGRQPWLAYGLIRRAEGHSDLTAGEVWVSLAGFIVAYTILFSLFVFFMGKLLKKGPNMDELPPAGHARG
ncbi:cytochrome bd ubiquinol oxidase subunit I [Solidesulfovibrio fructosivorans JJ]]|uniref:Cytochrome bd ubiquinol oxidase subunit I n=1 Tax=Solidesulfovibrio fructosivorans JJ] TaxID=596151 RepID=E1K0E1_SOLFR|nr:cytochrome ubiquinol oxidase subunit I [Solidesulfovibrio fructosivorans]EFL49884.1 cytochrome bd ubiquinol oxidase subunit I [Solidesulfovibrio fructosivorans JJ]]